MRSFSADTGVAVALGRLVEPELRGGIQPLRASVVLALAEPRVETATT